MKSKSLHTLILRILLPILWVAAVDSVVGQQLIPQPNQVTRHEGTFTITSQTVLVTHDFKDLANYLNDHIEQLCGFRLAVVTHAPDTNYISLRKNQHLTHEAYSLAITPRSIVIRGGDRGGIFYGLQTLFQLMPSEVFAKRDSLIQDSLPNITSLQLHAVTIVDAPRFAYRGAMLDVSRTFFTKEQVMQYLDWMSRHKLNRFHWHLTDDNGWRIEIKKYPFLTSKGAWRGPDEILEPAYGSGQKRYGGFYTQDDIREIVRYATFRNIEIIPEINLPGHALALTTSYPETFCCTNTATDESEMTDITVTGNVVCVGREENFEMIRDIIHEVAALFPSHYLHLGGDEVSTRYWQKCPRCQKLMKTHGMKSPKKLYEYFVNRVEKIAHEEGKRCVFWDEALSPALSSHTMISGWHDLATCKKAIDQEQPVIIMPASYCYIDMKQNAFERGHTWAWLVDTRRIYSLQPDKLTTDQLKQKYVRGVEAALWAELLDRPDRFFEYQSYPRLCALAEVGWSKPSQRNWEDFYSRLTQGHLPRLAAMGIDFYLFPPEVNYKQGMITATALPGASIYYTKDDSEPTQQSLQYTGPIFDTLQERYRFRSFYQGRRSPIVPVSTDKAKILPARSRDTITFPLNHYINHDGIWYLTITSSDPETVINRMNITGPDTTYSIIRYGQKANPFAPLRLYMDPRNRNADLTLIVTNNSTAENLTVFSFRPSPYLELQTEISSSLTFSSRFPSQRIADYNPTTYSRSTQACQAGDFLQYNFTDSITCRAIIVRTGIPNITRYIVTQGEVSYSHDGHNFVDAGVLDDNGCATIHPSMPVKAVRINITGDNGESIVAFQDLQILSQ